MENLDPASKYKIQKGGVVAEYSLDSIPSSGEKKGRKKERREGERKGGK